MEKKISTTRICNLLLFFEYNKSINTKTFFFSSLTKQLITNYFIKTISQLCDLDNVKDIQN